MTTTTLKYAVKFRQKQSVKKEFDNWSASDLINYIFDLRKEIENLNTQIFIQSNTETIAPSKITIEKNKEIAYNQTWSLPTKIVFLLELKQKPLLTLEIHQLLLQYDTSYKKVNTPKKRLSIVLTQAFKTKRILKYKRAGIKELLIVLPEWLKADGGLKENYISESTI